MLGRSAITGARQGDEMRKDGIPAISGGDRDRLVGKPDNYDG
ncbi:MAG: hypothetical protein AAFY11_00285 [Cyanobacteria bacterium J06641_5]